MILFEAKSKQGKTDWFHVFSEPCGKKHIHTFNGLHRRVVRGRVGTGNGCSHTPIGLLVILLLYDKLHTTSTIYWKQANFCTLSITLFNSLISITRSAFELLSKT